MTPVRKGRSTNPSTGVYDPLDSAHHQAHHQHRGNSCQEDEQGPGDRTVHFSPAYLYHVVYHVVAWQEPGVFDVTVPKTGEETGWERQGAGVRRRIGSSGSQEVS